MHCTSYLFGAWKESEGGLRAKRQDGIDGQTRGELASTFNTCNLALSNALSFQFGITRLLVHDVREASPFSIVLWVSESINLVDFGVELIAHTVLDGLNGPNAQFLNRIVTVRAA